MTTFFHDVGQAYRKAVRAFADAGCRYLQLDEVFIAMLCDEKYRQQMRDRGDDPEKLGEIYGDLINVAMSDIPSDMTITMHMCRGNYKSTHMGAGGYDAVQEILFNKINVHGYFMEYDDARSGGFEPLRMLPKGKQVVLGIVTTKTGKLESKDDLKRRIDEAAKYRAARSALHLGPVRLRRRPRKATSSPRTSNGRSSRASSRWRRTYGDRMQRTKPPFRADHVGSFLRTAPIKDARAKREQNAITAEQLKAVEDAEIKKIVAEQEECGLKLATDGEFRRSWWHFDFLCGLDGVVLKQIEQGIQFAGVQTKAERPDIVGKIGFSSHPMIEHFKFLKANTRVMPKMTIPSPTLLHFRFGRASIPKTLYPDLDPFFDDLGNDLRQGREGLLRRRLPLPAIRRHHLGVPLLREGARAIAPARRQSRTNCRPSTPK